MRDFLAITASLAAVSSLPGCTGDWDKDTIFFSPQKADVLIAAQGSELQQMRRSLAETQTQTQSLKRDLAGARNSAAVSQSTNIRLSSQIAELEMEAAALNSEMASVNEATADMRRREAEMRREVQRLHDELIFVLENRE